MEMADTHGEVAAGFEPVREAFAANFSERGDIGGAFCAYHNGQVVADLWGGQASRDQAWERNTMALVWSTTKGMSALVAHLLADSDRLDLDAPIASIWPEFGGNGKSDIIVRDILTHGARLPYVPGYRSVVSADSPDGWANTSALVALLESAEPVLPDGVHGYHAVTFGLLLGEVVRRAAGASLGSILREEVAGPLGLETYIGLPQDAADRVAELSLTIPPPPTDDPEFLAMMAEALGPNGPTGQALFVGDGGLDGFAAIGNDPAFRAAEHPAANGITDARSLARMYAMLANGGELDGVRVVSSESIRRHSAQQWRGVDASLGAEKRYAIGYMLAGTDTETFGPNPDSFGHPGMGGSLGFADPKHSVGFGYITNHMVFEVAVDPRARSLADAVYACLP